MSKPDPKNTQPEERSRSDNKSPEATSGPTVQNMQDHLRDQVQNQGGHDQSKSDSVNLPGATGPSQVSPDVHKKSDFNHLTQELDLARLIVKEKRAGAIVIGLFAGFMALWAVLSPLTSAAVAPGVISPEGSRKVVQHLEGGIIDRILVSDGDVVKSGDPLILLEDTMAKASYEVIRTRYFSLAAQEARLLSIQAGENDIIFSDSLLNEAQDPKVAEILNGQGEILKTQLRAHEDRKAVLRQRIAQLNEEIKGLEAQIVGQRKQLSLIEQEIKAVETLVGKGLERRPRLLSLQRAEAEIIAALGANQAQVSRTHQAIGQTELELIAADTQLQDDVARELAQLSAGLAEATEKLVASGDILNRIRISAPVAGTVVGLRVHTSGGVIAPGESLMEIVPSEQGLIIDARVSPVDIDMVHQGLEAQIHLTAFSQRNLPRINGTVLHVSADRLIDQVTGEPYFQAKIGVNPEAMAALGDDFVLVAGMPAEVMIVTGEQTLFGYLMKPLTATFRKAFREG